MCSLGVKGTLFCTYCLPIQLWWNYPKFYLAYHNIIFKIFRGMAKHESTYVVDGGWSPKSGRLGGEWVVKGGRWRGPVGMWPVGWWSGTRMKECERCGYECEVGDGWRTVGGGDGTTRKRKKKAEENEKGDKKNRVLDWGSNPVRSGCTSGGVTTRTRGNSRYRFTISAPMHAQVNYIIKDILLYY